jgi:hypothetical protein
MAQIYSDITKGTITPENQKYLQDVLGAMEEANKRNAAEKTGKFISGRSKILKLSPEELGGYLGIVESAAPQGKEGAPSPTSGAARKAVSAEELP